MYAAKTEPPSSSSYNSNRDYNNSNRDYNGYYRGRGRGGRYYNRARGRGRYNDRYQDNLDMSKIECFRCDKMGHFAYVCPDLLLKLQEPTETKEKDADTTEAEELMMHEIFYLNEKNVNPQDFKTSSDSNIVWYLDNGASNHMTGNRRYFKSIDESITDKVRFGDDSRIDIKGKGPILFCLKDGGKKILTDV